MGTLRVALILSTILIGLYLIVLAGLWVGQRPMIFPAPKDAVPLPAGFIATTTLTADGLTLKAAYRRAAPGRPTIIFFHGNGDSWSGAAVATQGLATSGYGVFLPEYRGYAGNPGSPSEEGLYHDGRAALSWLTSHGIAPSKIIIIGNSVGSGVACQIATETAPAALVLVSPFAALDALVVEEVPIIPTRLLVRDRFDNISKLPHVQAPILLLHGTADTLIPAHHSLRLATARPDAELMLIPMIGHELVYTDAAQQRMIAWLDARFPSSNNRESP